MSNTSFLHISYFALCYIILFFLHIFVTFDTKFIYKLICLKTEIRCYAIFYKLVVSCRIYFLLACRCNINTYI